MRVTPPDRNEVILELRKKGKTLQAISKLFGLSRERVRQILAEEGYTHPHNLTRK